MSDPEPLVLDDVEDVAGEVFEGRTVEILLQDGRVLVSRVRQIQTGPIPCPGPDCFRRFDSTRGVKTHVGKFHPELVTKECPECGRPFHPSPRSQTYCSAECHDEALSDQVTLICEECGSSFDVKASHADSRKHCSRECANDSTRELRACPTCGDDFEVRQSDPDVYCSRACYRNRPTENTREERSCPECGDTFEVYPSRDQIYCSQVCYSASRWETRTCPMCGDEFQSHRENKHLEREHCSAECMYERRRSDPRPDDPDALLDELVDEDHDVDAVVGRAHAHLGPGWSSTDVRLWYVLRGAEDYQEAAVEVAEQLDGDRDVDGLRDLLLEIAAAHHGAPGRFGGAALHQLLDDADTLLEVADGLRVSRSEARKLVRRLGLLGDFQAGRFKLEASLRDQQSAAEVTGSDD